MGKLAELYREQKQIQYQYVSGPVPNKATQQAEYLEYQKNKRTFERKFQHLRALIKSQTYTLEQALDVFEKAGGKEVREAREKALENSNFYGEYWEKLRKEQPAVFEGVSAEEMNALEKDDVAKKTFVKNLLTEGKIDEKAYREAAGTYMVFQYSDFSSNHEVDMRVVDGLEQLLSEEQQKAILDQYAAYQDPMELPDAEKVTYPYKERTDELLKQMPPEIASDPKKREQYERVLGFAAEHLTAPNEILRQEGLSIDTDIQAIESAIDRHVRDVVRPTYQNGKYDGIYQKNDAFRSFHGVAEDKREVFDELRRDGIQLSEKTKEGIRLMTQKMAEMGLEKYPHAANGEDTGKIYSFNKLVATKAALTEALKEGDPEKILAAGQEYEKTYHDMEELYRISREYFNQEPSVFPGNMDSIRNRAIPYAFTSDMQNTAFINSVFQTYINVKENNMNLEDYLKNPVEGNLKDAEKKWEATCFKKVSERATSLEDAIDLMANAGDFEDAGQDLKDAVPMWGFGRQLNMPNTLEADSTTREKNNIVAYTLSKDMFDGAVLDSEQAKFLYFYQEAKTPMEEKAKLDTLKNLMLASDEERDLNKIFAGLPETDYLGRKVGEGFDAQGHIAKTPVDYEGIIDRAKRIQEKSTEYGGMTWLNEKKALEATRQLYTEILLAHPEDMEKEGFKKMQKALDRTYDRIQEYDQEELNDLARENKEILQDMLDENRRKYLIENEPVQELRRLEAEAIRTGDFSKYASFMVDVAAKENDLRDEVYKEYTKYQDEIFAKDQKRNFVKGNDFYMKLCHAVNEIDFEANVAHSMKSEELAAQIRNGEIPVDPAFDDVKKDYHSSRILANQILAGSEIDERVRGTKALGMNLEEASPRLKNLVTIFQADRVRQMEEFYEKGKIAGSAGDRRRYLYDAQQPVSTNLGEVREDGSIEPPKQEDISERLQKSSDRALEYQQMLERIKEDAQKKLDEMNGDGLGGRSGSDQYKAMYDSLEAVTKLNANNTPGEIGQALENMRISTVKYKDKIDGQLFANIRQKGKNRYNFANQLGDYAGDVIAEMTEKAYGNLALNEKLSDQINRAVTNLDEYQTKQARPEGLVVDEKLLNDVDKAVENLKEAQNAKVQNDVDKAVENLKNPQNANVLDGIDNAVENLEKVQNANVLDHVENAMENLKEAQNANVLDQVENAMENLKKAQNANILDDIDKVVENLEHQREKKEAAFMKKAKEAEKALNAMGPGLYKPDGSLWEEKMDAFIKVATAKEIERRGGLAAGETHHTITKELFGRQEQRNAVFNMLKKNDGATLNQIAASPDLKQKLEPQMNLQKNKKQEGPKPEKNEEIKRSNTL